MKKEFNIGDEVTFNAYGNKIKAVVKNIKCGMAGNGLNYLGIPDDRIFYDLSGINKSLKTSTTGESIAESIYFQQG